MGLGIPEVLTILALAGLVLTAFASALRNFSRPDDRQDSRPTKREVQR